MEAGATQQVAAQQSTTELGTPPVALMPEHPLRARRNHLGRGWYIYRKSLQPGNDLTHYTQLALTEEEFADTGHCHSKE
jgi:hypothetical protein